MLTLTVYAGAQAPANGYEKQGIDKNREIERDAISLAPRPNANAVSDGCEKQGIYLYKLVKGLCQEEGPA